MFKEVQRLKIQELEIELEQLLQERADILNECSDVRSQFNALNEFANKGMRVYRGKQKFNLVERFFTARKAYQAYRAKLAEYRKLPQLLAVARQQLSAAEDLADAKLKASGVVPQIETLEKTMQQIKNSKTLEELGFDVTTASQYLEAHGIPVNLGKGDEAILDRYLNYKNNLETIVVGYETNDHQRLAHFNAFGSTQQNIYDHRQD